MSTDRPSPPGTPRYSRTQRWLLTASAGLLVAALAGGAFAVTYDALRDFAVAGRAGKRWAPLYPGMADTLVAMTILSLVVARHSRWWSRWLRWTLLLVLLAGAAAIGVQHRVWGFDSLPDRPVEMGVAVAPHVMLVIAVWLWLTMFKQIRTAPPVERKADPEPSSPAPEAIFAPEPEPEPEPAASEPVPPPALLATDVELVRQRTADGPAEAENATGASTTQPDLTVRAKTTQPDLIMPLTLDPAEEESEFPAVDRAEDPDAGDEEDEIRGRHHLGRPPTGQDPAPEIDLDALEATDPGGHSREDDLPIWDWNPPSGTFRSSPTPPAD